MTTHPKPEAQTPVLWDEDYRAHIEKLNRMLERERHEVWDLRQEVRRLKKQAAEPKGR